MYFKTRKSNFFLVILLSSILFVSGCSASSSSDKKNNSEIKLSETIQKEKNNINKKTNEILSEKDSTKKMTAYKNLISESNTYDKSDKKEKEIVTTYKESIDKIKDSFKSQDNQTYKDNQLTDVAAASKETLTQKIDVLKKLKEWIQKESNIVYNQKELPEFNAKIDNTMNSYQDQLTKLEAAEQDESEPSTSSSVETEAASTELTQTEVNAQQNNLLNTLEEAAASLAQQMPQSGDPSAFQNGRKNDDGSFTFDYQLYGNQDGVRWNRVVIDNNGKILSDDYLKTIPQDLNTDLYKDQQNNPKTVSISRSEAANIAIDMHNQLGRPASSLSEEVATAEGYYFDYTDRSNRENSYKYFVSTSGEVTVL